MKSKQVNNGDGDFINFLGYLFLLYFNIFFFHYTQVELSQLRTSLLETLGQVQDILPLINKMLFGPMAYLYTVYQLECLRLTTHTNLVPILFPYLEDRAIQKDKNGKNSFMKDIL